MMKRITVFSLIGLAALALALSFPVVEQTAGWGTGTALGAETGSKDRGPGKGTISDSGEGGLNQRPGKPSKIPEPATLFSLLMGAGGVALFVRASRKDKA